jgi:hypothetical protein
VRSPHGHRLQAWWALGHPHETVSVPEEHGTSLVGKARVEFYVKHNAVIMTRRGSPAQDLDQYPSHLRLYNAVGSCSKWLLMQNEIWHKGLAPGVEWPAGGRVHAIVILFLEYRQKDLQRRCSLCSTDPSEAWWPGDVHDNNLNRLGQARRVYD